MVQNINVPQTISFMDTSLVILSSSQGIVRNGVVIDQILPVQLNYTKSYSNIQILRASVC